jgi:uncharacterized protein (UPF0218 family)
VLYGLPAKGIVFVNVDEGVRQKAKKFMNSMEESI